MASTAPFGTHYPIVGREHERSGLGALLDQVRAGDGSLVLIGGPAGIGKTTLVHDLEARARQRGMLVLSGYCYDLSVTSPYQPWIQIARASTQIDGLPAPPDAFRVEGALDQSASQQLLFQEFQHYLVSIADVQPLVLILEDLHWSDQESLEFLRWLGHEVDQLPVLIVVTYRDDELTRQGALYAMLPILVRETMAHRVNLQPLDDRAVRSLVSSHYSLPEDAETQLTAYLQARAEGNPFFLNELLRSLEEEGRLCPTGDGTWILTNLDHLPVPPLVEQVIDRRLNRLDESARKTLEVASVIGQNVPLDLWSSISQMTEGELTIAIQQSVDAHLLEDARDGARLRFPHALIREVLYEGLLLPRRRALHLQVADELMKIPGIEPDTIAYHLQQAGDPRAIDWFIRAGIRAERVAWLTAAEHLEAALQLMRAHDVEPVERGWLIIRLVRLLRFSDMNLSFALLDEGDEYASVSKDPILAAYIAFCRIEVRGYSGSGWLTNTYDEASAINALRTLSSADRRRLDELIESGALVSDHILLATHAASLAQHGRCGEAIDLAQAIIADDRDVPAEAPWALANAYALTGRIVEARDAYTWARRTFASNGDYSMAGATALYELFLRVLTYQTDNMEERKRVLAEGEIAWTRAEGAQGNAPRLIHLPVLVLEGHWDDAWSMLREARSLNMTAMRRAFFKIALAQLAHARGRYERAWDLLGSVLRYDVDGRPVANSHVAGMLAQQIAAYLAIGSGDLEMGRDWIQSVDHWFDETDTLLGRADNQILWAIYHRATGNYAKASSSAQSALETAAEPRQPLALLRAYRVLGELETTSDNSTAAERHLQTSVRLATDCKAPYEQALTHLALAELNLAVGESDNAWRSIDQVRAICIPLGAKPALQRATEIAARLSVRRGSPVHPAGLTPREVEVLQLVAGGLTDTEVALQLSVSPRTVNTHLTSIYNKLGVNSRVEATRFAVEQGLLESL